MTDWTGMQSHCSATRISLEPSLSSVPLYETSELGGGCDPRNRIVFITVEKSLWTGTIYNDTELPS